MPELRIVPRSVRPAESVVQAVVQVGGTPAGPPWFAGAGQHAVDQFRVTRQNAAAEVSGRGQNRADSLLPALEDTAAPAGLLVPDQRTRPAGRPGAGPVKMIVASRGSRGSSQLRSTTRPLVVRRCTALVT